MYQQFRGIDSGGARIHGGHDAPLPLLVAKSRRFDARNCGEFASRCEKGSCRADFGLPWQRRVPTTFCWEFGRAGSLVPRRAGEGDQDQSRRHRQKTSDEARVQGRRGGGTGGHDDHVTRLPTVDRADPLLGLGNRAWAVQHLGAGHQRRKRGHEQQGCEQAGHGGGPQRSRSRAPRRGASRREEVADTRSQPGRRQAAGRQRACISRVPRPQAARREAISQRPGAAGEVFSPHEGKRQRPRIQRPGQQGSQEGGAHLPLGWRRGGEGGYRRSAAEPPGALRSCAP